jgi:hypothetical protein
MISSILIGFGASIVTEIITWINKKATGTVFSGQGAFIIALIVAVILAIIKVLIFPLIPTAVVQQFTLQAGLVFSASQVFFYWIIKMFNLTVQPSA